MVDGFIVLRRKTACSVYQRLIFPAVLRTVL